MADACMMHIPCTQDMPCARPPCIIMQAKRRSADSEASSSYRYSGLHNGRVGPCHGSYQALVDEICKLYEQVQQEGVIVGAPEECK